MAVTAPSAGRRVPCEKCPLRPKKTFRPFTAEELDFVSGFKSGELNAEAGSSILLEGTNSAHLYTVLSGWAFRYKMLEDGRRQVLNFALPGDFLGLQGSVTEAMQHSVEALTDMVLCIFPREKLWSLYSGQPSLAFDVTWLAAHEEATVDENLVSVGRRSALERTAYLLLHLFIRAELLGLTQGSRVTFPFTQQLIADTLGMSLVHTNKTLKKLAASKAIRWKDKVFEILDRHSLADIAGHDNPEPSRRPLI